MTPDTLTDLFVLTAGLDEPDPLSRAIAQEFFEACPELPNDIDSAALHLARNIQIDNCALNLIRDICRFVDALKGHKA